MKDWKFLLAVIFIAAILGKIFIPSGDHAASPQAISVANGAPSGSCVSPLVYVDSMNAKLYVCSGGNWIPLLPSGMMVTSLSPCGQGWSEVSSLNGQFTQGTTAANNDVGTAGAISTAVIPANVVGLSTTVNIIPTNTKVIFCQLP